MSAATQPHLLAFEEIVANLRPAPVVEGIHAPGATVALDLSVNNPRIPSGITPTDGLAEFVASEISRLGGIMGYGGYLEHRDLYGPSAHFGGEERRDIHLGIDIWAPAGTALFAALAGKIHSFQRNDNFLDYGPTIILEHSVQNLTFHTLYGHLSVDSLDGLCVGQAIAAGQPIAKLGDPAVNGNWPPHLHYQVIIDMQGLRGDYPGVSARSKLPFYSKNCPNPALLLGL